MRTWTWRCRKVCVFFFFLRLIIQRSDGKPRESYASFNTLHQPWTRWESEPWLFISQFVWLTHTHTHTQKSGPACRSIPACVRALILSCYFLRITLRCLGGGGGGGNVPFLTSAKLVTPRPKAWKFHRTCSCPFTSATLVSHFQLCYATAALTRCRPECFAYRCNISGGGEVSIPLKKTCVSLLGASLNGDGVFVCFFCLWGQIMGSVPPPWWTGQRRLWERGEMKINHTLEMVFPL